MSMAHQMMFGRRVKDLSSQSSFSTSTGSFSNDHKNRHAPTSDQCRPEPMDVLDARMSIPMPLPAEDVLTNLGFCQSGSFIPQRFLKDWVNKTRRIQANKKDQQCQQWIHDAVAFHLHQMAQGCQLGGDLEDRSGGGCDSSNFGDSEFSDSRSKQKSEEGERRSSSGVEPEAERTQQLRSVLERHSQLLSTTQKEKLQRRRWKQFASQRSRSLATIPQEQTDSPNGTRCFGSGEQEQKEHSEQEQNLHNWPMRYSAEKEQKEHSETKRHHVQKKNREHNKSNEGKEPSKKSEQSEQKEQEQKEEHREEEDGKVGQNLWEQMGAAELKGDHQNQSGSVEKLDPESELEKGKVELWISSGFNVLATIPSEEEPPCQALGQGSSRTVGQVLHSAIDQLSTQVLAQLSTSAVDQMSSPTQDLLPTPIPDQASSPVPGHVSDSVLDETPCPGPSPYVFADLPSIVVSGSCLSHSDSLEVDEIFNPPTKMDDFSGFQLIVDPFLSVSRNSSPSLGSHSPNSISPVTVIEVDHLDSRGDVWTDCSDRDRASSLTTLIIPGDPNYHDDGSDGTSKCSSLSAMYYDAKQWLSSSDTIGDSSVEAMSPENDVSEFRCTSVPAYLPSFAEDEFGCSSPSRNSQQNLGNYSLFSYGESRGDVLDESLSPLMFSRHRSGYDSMGLPDNWSSSDVTTDSPTVTNAAMQTSQYWDVTGVVSYVSTHIMPHLCGKCQLYIMKGDPFRAVDYGVVQNVTDIDSTSFENVQLVAKTSGLYEEAVHCNESYT